MYNEASYRSLFQWSTCTIPCYTPDKPKSSGRNTRSRDCNHIKNKSKGQDQHCEGKDLVIEKPLRVHRNGRGLRKLVLHESWPHDSWTMAIFTSEAFGI